MRVISEEGKAVHLFQSRALDLAGLYDRYANMLYRLALSYLRSDEDARDAVQDVFIKVVEQTPRFRDVEHQRAWLVRATINRSCDLLRRRSVRTSVPLDQAANLPAHVSNEAQEVLDCLSRVPEKYRAAVTLHDLEGFSVEETARMLRISQSAVKMRLHRGRLQLKAQWEENGYV